MSPRSLPKIDPPDLPVSPNKIWVPLSIFGGCLVIAFTLGAGFSRLMWKLDSMERSAWTTAKMKDYNWEARFKNPSWVAPDVDVIIKSSQ